MICRFCKHDVKDPCHNREQMQERASWHVERCAVARAQGLNGAAWLDQLEVQFVRNTKNMTFTGCSMDAEAASVEAALANLKTITTAVRAQMARRHESQPRSDR